MYSFEEKNRIVQQLSNEEFFEKDKELFFKYCSNTKVEQAIKRVNDFTRKEIDARIIYELLNKVKKEDILKNRSKVEVVIEEPEPDNDNPPPVPDEDNNPSDLPPDNGKNQGEPGTDTLDPVLPEGEKSAALSSIVYSLLENKENEEEANNMPKKKEEVNK